MVGTWLNNFCLLCPSRKIPGTIYNKTTTIFFYILPNLLFINQTILVWATDGVFKQTINAYVNHLLKCTHKCVPMLN